jgi:hypothetical protein
VHSGSDSGRATLQSQGGEGEKKWGVCIVATQFAKSVFFYNPSVHSFTTGVVDTCLFLFGGFRTLLALRELDKSHINAGF